MILKKGNSALLCARDYRLEGNIYNISFLWKAIASFFYEFYDLTSFHNFIIFILSSLYRLNFHPKIIKLENTTLQIIVIFFLFIYQL